MAFYNKKLNLNGSEIVDFWGRVAQFAPHNDGAYFSHINVCMHTYIYAHKHTKEMRKTHKISCNLLPKFSMRSTSINMRPLWVKHNHAGPINFFVVRVLILTSSLSQRDQSSSIFRKITTQNLISKLVRIYFCSQIHEAPLIYWKSDQFSTGKNISIVTKVNNFYFFIPFVVPAFLFQTKKHSIK